MWTNRVTRAFGYSVKLETFNGALRYPLRRVPIFPQSQRYREDEPSSNVSRAANGELNVA